ncbi:MAG: hypothetical protein R3B48_21065 [Kofleriaceae bacterium]
MKRIENETQKSQDLLKYRYKQARWFRRDRPETLDLMAGCEGAASSWLVPVKRLGDRPYETNSDSTGLQPPGRGGAAARSFAAYGARTPTSVRVAQQGHANRRVREGAVRATRRRIVNRCNVIDLVIEVRSSSANENRSFTEFVTFGRRAVLRPV